MATKRNNEGVKVEPLRHSDALYGVMEEANLYRIIESDGDYRVVQKMSDRTFGILRDAAGCHHHEDSLQDLADQRAIREAE